MAESPRGERTEQPTQRRLEKAHGEGRVARSAELSGAAVLLGGGIALALTGGTAIAEQLTALVAVSSGWLAVGEVDLQGTVGMLRTVSVHTLSAMVPFLLGIVALALLVNMIQARGVLSLGPVTPKWSKVSPVSGLKRIFSWHSPFNLLKSVLKLVILLTVTFLVLRTSWPEIIALSDHGSGAVIIILRRLVLKMIFTAGVGFLAVAALDYLFQYLQHHKQLRMSRREVLDEHKETEGDPLIKSRIRSLARSLSRQRMLANVQLADVVVTNPTHIAVALKYDLDVAIAPTVLAMGRRKLAERIKSLAHEAGVPLVENQPLAHALIATATVGQPIPPALYMAVAEVLAFVYRLRNKAPRIAARQPAGIST